MAQYTVLERSWIGGKIVEPGEVVDYDGDPGTNLALITPGSRKGTPGKKTSADKDDD